DDEQRLVRIAAQFSFEDPVHFAEFLHQVALGLQASRSVENADIALARPSRMNRVVGHSRRITSGLMGDHFRPRPFSPYFQLIDRCRTKRVTGTDQYTPSLTGKPMR